MKNLFYFFIFLSVMLLSAQDNTMSRDSITKYTQQDFAQMKEQLGITIPNRPGPSGNLADPNAANTNENNVGSYSLPNPLVNSNGTKVLTEDAWWNSRRPEILQQFETEMYGRKPKNIPNVSWSVVSEKDTMASPYPVTERMFLGKVNNAAYPNIDVNIELLIDLPKNLTQSTPLVTRFGFIESPFGPPPAEPNSYFMSSYEPLWKQQLISQNWGYAILVPSTIQTDNGVGLTSGIIGLVNKGEHRNPEDWGALRAWAWGAEKAMDYFETDPLIDATRIGIEGTSRYGKAALAAMAFDPRFSIGFIGSSGAGGASILRRNFGEMAENLASYAEYHWFNGNFIKYASILKIDNLPVDAHELIALCAPRPVFISLGSPLIEGNWVDGKGMFLAGVEAGPVYELLGKSGLPTTTYPTMGTALTDGEIAFRQHAGGHSTGPNWSTWIAWAHKTGQINKNQYNYLNT